MNYDELSIQRIAQAMRCTDSMRTLSLHDRLSNALQEYEPDKSEHAWKRWDTALWEVAVNNRDDPSIVVAALNLNAEDDAGVGNYTDEQYTAALLVCGVPADPSADADIVSRVQWCEKLYDYHAEHVPGEDFVGFSKAYDRWWELKKEKDDEDIR